MLFSIVRPAAPLAASAASIAQASLLASLIFLTFGSAGAQTPQGFAPSGLFAAGDLAVSGFSGTVLATPSLPPGVNPVDRTLIDPEAPSLRVFDMTDLGGPLTGQLVNTPLKLRIPAKDIGQVFALAFDPGNAAAGRPPTLYAAATSAYGLQIVGSQIDADGKPVRLKRGAPGARFMDGQFGALPGGSPGAIWRIDGTTGQASLFADTGTSGLPNMGPGIGDIAFDPQRRMLYASDLDTGLIHQFAVDQNGTSLARFDYGVTGRQALGVLPSIPDDGRRLDLTDPNFDAEAPRTWGLTQPERRVQGLVVHDGRLFFAVGSSILSVGLNPDGGFGADVRFEVRVQAQEPLPITSIVFDRQGRMVLAQRGAQKAAYDYGQLVEAGAPRVLRYTVDASGRWSPEPQEYSIGFPDGHRMSAGGVSLQYAFGPDGRINPAACHATLVATGDALRDNPALAAPLASGGPAAVHGVQLSFANSAAPANAPPLLSAYIDFDGRTVDADARGHIGDVAALAPCDGAVVFGPGGVAPSFPPGPASPSGLPAIPPPLPADAPLPGVPGGVAPSFPQGPGSPGGLPGTPPPLPADAPLPGGPAPLPGGPAPLPGGPGGGQAGDPNAANLAVRKTQDCRLDGADRARCAYTVTITNAGTTDFDFAGGGLTDTLSVTPTELVLPAALANVQKTPNGFRLGTSMGSNILKPNASQQLISFRTSFAVPAGGLTVENCAALTFAAAGTPAAAPFTPVEPLPPPPDLPASTSNGFDGAVAVTGAPQCAVRGSERDCTWTVTISNPGTLGVAASFMFTTSKPATRIAGPSGLSAVPVNATLTFFGENLVLPPKAVKSYTIKATFANEPGPVTATVANGHTVADVNQANNQAVGNAGTAAPQNIPSTATASRDGNPGDNTSCVKWDSTKPNENPPPTNAPTQPQQQGGGQPPPGAPQQPPPGGGQPPPAGQQPPPPAQQAQLKIEKRAMSLECSSSLGCEFEITVVNTGATPFTGPITISEAPRFGGKMLTAAKTTTVPNAPWTCTKPVNDFECTHPSTTIAPNGSITLRLGLSAGIVVKADLATEMENCATLKPQGNTACVRLPLAQGPKLTVTKRAILARCTPTCLFEVRINNIGNEPFDGEFGLIDQFGVTGPLISSPELPITTFSSQPGFCKTINITGFIICDFPKLVLQPGQSTAVQMTIGTPKAFVRLQNCAFLTPKALGAEPACVGIQGASPVGKAPNLRVEKTAAGTECPLRGPCTFNVKVTNMGPVDYKGLITVVDSVNQLGTTFKTEGPFNCIPQDSFGLLGARCVHGSTTLLPGASVFMRMNMTPAPAQEKGNILRNCAKLIYDPDGNDPGADKSDDEACAELKLDPFALKLTKTGNQSCEPGSDCRFELTIFNPGPILHDAPVIVTDSMGGVGTMPIVSIAPPLGCPQQPTSIPFTCTIPNMRLEVGQQVKHTVTVRLPQQGAASTALRNCAEISSPPDGTASRRAARGSEQGAPRGEAVQATRAGGTATSDDKSSACHDVTVAPARTTTPTPPPPVQFVTCTGGMVLGADGRCACPAGMAWGGRQCVADVAPQQCPPGTSGIYPNCIYAASGGSNQTQPTPACPPGTAGIYPNCIGAASGGTSRTQQMPACPPGTSGIYPNCIGSASGGSSRTQPTPACPPGTRRVGNACQPLACPAGTVGSPPNCRSCPPNTRLEGNRCTPLSCPLGMTGVPPTCCPPGTRYANGRCERPPQSCPSGQVGTPPHCACPSGTRMDRYRRCIPVSTTPAPAPQQQQPQPQTCPPGTVIDQRFRRCRHVPRGGTGPAPSQRCTPPRIGTPPNCACPRGLTGPNCDQVIVR